MKLSIAILITALSSFNAYSNLSAPKANDYPSLIRKRVDNVISNMQHKWRYNVEHIENINEEQKTTYSSYDPKTHPINWTLLTFNNRAPTSSEKQEYRETHNDWAAESLDLYGSDSRFIQILAFIDFGSLTITSQDSENTTYSFHARNKKFGDSATGKLDGMIVMSRSGDALRQITITNNADFSANWILSVKTWQRAYEFTEIEQQTLLVKETSSLQASAGLFGDINVTATMTFENHEPIKTEINQ